MDGDGKDQVPHGCRHQRKGLQQTVLKFEAVFFTLLHPNISRHILPTALDTFPRGTDKENVYNNQDIFKYVIITFILFVWFDG